MTDTSPPKDPRLIEAEIRTAEANARKAAAEATTAELDAVLPDVPAEVTAGTLTTPEKTEPVATLAAYRAMVRASSAIAQHLPAGQSVWIVPNGDFQVAIDTYRILKVQLARLTRLAQNAVQPATLDQPLQPPPSPGEPQPAIRSAASSSGSSNTASEPQPEERSLSAAVALAASAAPLVMSLFATNRTVTSADVTIDFATAAAAVAAVTKTKPRILGITPPAEAQITSSADGEVASQVNALQTARDALAAAILIARRTAATTEAESRASAEADAWKAVIAEVVKTDATKADEIVSKIGSAASLAAVARNDSTYAGDKLRAAEQLLLTVDTLLQQLTGDSGAALTARASLGAAIEGQWVLVLQPTYSGVSSVYEDVKLKRDRALHVGSSVVTWYLLDDKHDLFASGIEAASDSASTKVGEPGVSWENKAGLER